jgi:hypothetical protein
MRGFLSNIRFVGRFCNVEAVSLFGWCGGMCIIWIGGALKELNGFLVDCAAPFAVFATVEADGKSVQTFAFVQTEQDRLVVFACLGEVEVPEFELTHCRLFAQVHLATDPEFVFCVHLDPFFGYNSATNVSIKDICVN